MSYLALPQEQQPKLPPPSYGKANGVILMLRSMVVLLTTTMQSTVEGESHQDILELRTRLFMNAGEEFERPLRRKEDLQMKKDQEEQERKKAEAAKSQTNTKVGGKKNNKTIKDSVLLPIWIEKYNFLSMLNLTEIIQYFVSPRHYFEEKHLGERFVQDVKNMRPRCPPKQVLMNLLL
jgi:hypothetical protein